MRPHAPLGAIRIKSRTQVIKRSPFWPPKSQLCILCMQRDGKTVRRPIGRRNRLFYCSLLFVEHFFRKNTFNFLTFFDAMQCKRWLEHEKFIFFPGISVYVNSFACHFLRVSPVLELEQRIFEMDFKEYRGIEKRLGRI